MKDPFKGFTFPSEEEINKDTHLERIRIANKQKANDPNWRAKITQAAREKANDPNWRAKITQINRDKVKDPEHLKKKAKAAKKAWNNPKLRKWAEEFYGDAEYRKNLSERNKKIAERDKDKIKERNKKLSQDPKWIEKNAAAQSKRSKENIEWIRKNCKPVSTPYGIFEKTKDAAAAYHRDHPTEVWESVCLKLRRWYKDKKQTDWNYITWEEYDNLTK